MNIEKLKEIVPFRFRIWAKNAAGTSFMVLPYLDSRDVMDLLDEACGVWHRQRRYNNAWWIPYCEVGILIWDTRVWKSDCGEKSKISPDKWQASDSFKRACVNWWVGRFLYTIPALRISKAEADSHKYKITEFVKTKHKKVLSNWFKENKYNPDNMIYKYLNESDDLWVGDDSQDVTRKSEIDSIENVKELTKYRNKNKWQWPDFDAYVLSHKQKLLDDNS